jgi:hypothetical protein
MNLESARHEAIMDDDLKDEFRIVNKFLKGMQASIDVRNRRRRAQTYLWCFTGEEIVMFMATNKVTISQVNAETMAQKMLEIGFVDRSMAPKSRELHEADLEAARLEDPDSPTVVHHPSFSSRDPPPVLSFSPDTKPGSAERPATPDDIEVDLLLDSMERQSRTRGATILARMWAEDSMIFNADLHRLYTIGDITPSTLNLMSSNTAQKARKLKRKQEAVDAKRRELLQRETSVFCMGRTNPLRVLSVRIIVNPKFENFILFLIGFSSILLALDEPSVALDKTTTLYKFLYYSDFVLTGLFVIEMSLKIIAMGFFSGKGSYLGNSWNVLDFFIVLVSVFGIIMADKIDLSFLKSLRAMRGLRPLRMVSRAPGMKMVVNAIFIALPACVNVVMVVLLCFLVFAIVGNTFFSGLFYYCSGEEGDKYTLDRVDCVGSFTDSSGVTYEREWVNYPHHFDTVPQGISTLFEIASLEMWPDIMAAAQDVTVVDEHPVRDNNFGYAYFFVFFIFIGSFFVINLFVGVVINKFSQVKAEGDGNSLFMSAEAQEWVRAQKAIMQVRRRASARERETDRERERERSCRRGTMDHLPLTPSLPP